MSAKREKWNGSHLDSSLKVDDMNSCKRKYVWIFNKFHSDSSRFPPQILNRPSFNLSQKKNNVFSFYSWMERKKSVLEIFIERKASAEIESFRQTLTRSTFMSQWSGWSEWLGSRIMLYKKLINSIAWRHDKKHTHIHNIRRLFVQFDSINIVAFLVRFNRSQHTFLLQNSPLNSYL